jgi:AraC-like DNA-binding protein
VRDLVSTVILLGALQGVVLAPVLWARRANRLANQILAALVGAVALMLLLGEVGGRWGFAGHPHLLGLGAPLPFLFSPLLYLYVVALTRPITRFDPRWLAHGLPFAADVLFMGQAFYTKTAAEKVALALLSDSAAVPPSLLVATSFEIVQALVYLFLGWRELARYRRKMQGYFSDLARIDLRWLRALVLAHVAVWSVVLVSTVLRAIAHTAGVLGNVVPLGSSFAIFLTGYVSLWQPELVQKATAAKVAEQETTLVPQEPAPAPLRKEAADPPPRPKYQRNRLDDAEARELVTKLEELMADKQLYREPGLTLPTLADELGVTPHMLSQILNVRIGKSFFVYVNTYRAAALQEALADPSKSERGVLELALEVGFSSKSTLNASFKKQTAMTPTEFRAHAGRKKTS